MGRITGLALAIGAAPPALAEQPTLDTLAQRYVAIVLEYGEHEPGYVDAYYGPADGAAAAKAHPRNVGQLTTDTTALAKALARAAAPTADDVRRRTFLEAQIRAIRTRLAMTAGTKFKFDAEAKGLFSVVPPLKPLAAYDPILAQIDAMVPGQGTLADRVDAFRLRYRIPADRLDAVMHAAIAECRARTMRHIVLPADETFSLEFVTKQPWSGYNWYKGHATSLIQVNTDLPIFIDRAVDLGCHEGYPGHHALNVLLEEKLTKARNWPEFAVYPLFSPQSLIAEGTANYGIELAFPGEERLAFERDTLYPLAGLDPATAAAYAKLGEATKALAGARLTIAQLYLDGKIDRPQAVALAQKYQLVSLARAEQSIAFTDKYRSYVINYATGLDMARAKVESAGASPAARWHEMEWIISGPTVPADLAVSAAAVEPKVATR